MIVQENNKEPPQLRTIDAICEFANAHKRVIAGAALGGFSLAALTVLSKSPALDPTPPLPPSSPPTSTLPATCPSHIPAASVNTKPPIFPLPSYLFSTSWIDSWLNFTKKTAATTEAPSKLLLIDFVPQKKELPIKLIEFVSPTFNQSSVEKNDVLPIAQKRLESPLSKQAVPTKTPSKLLLIDFVPQKIEFVSPTFNHSSNTEISTAKPRSLAPAPLPIEKVTPWDPPADLSRSLNRLCYPTERIGTTLGTAAITASLGIPLFRSSRNRILPLKLLKTAKNAAALGLRGIASLFRTAPQPPGGGGCNPLANTAGIAAAVRVLAREPDGQLDCRTEQEPTLAENQRQISHALLEVEREGTPPDLLGAGTLARVVQSELTEILRQGGQLEQVRQIAKATLSPIRERLSNAQTALLRMPNFPSFFRSSLRVPSQRLTALGGATDAQVRRGYDVDYSTMLLVAQLVAPTQQDPILHPLAIQNLIERQANEEALRAKFTVKNEEVDEALELLQNANAQIKQLEKELLDQQEDTSSESLSPFPVPPTDSPNADFLPFPVPPADSAADGGQKALEALKKERDELREIYNIKMEELDSIWDKLQEHLQFQVDVAEDLNLPKDLDEIQSNKGQTN